MYHLTVTGGGGGRAEDTCSILKSTICRPHESYGKGKAAAASKSNNIHLLELERNEETFLLLLLSSLLLT
jgi:hypothetical protein